MSNDANEKRKNARFTKKKANTFVNNLVSGLTKTNKDCLFACKWDIFHSRLYTTGVHDQSTDICIQGYLKILWIRNTNYSKID